MYVLIFLVALFSSTLTYSQEQALDELDLSAPPLQAPTLEQAPAADTILAPLINLIPQISSFTMPTHQSACYAPSFQVMTKTFVMSQPCELIEPHRGLIALVSVLMWSISAFLIIMGA
jgi:hypothetical protein